MFMFWCALSQGKTLCVQFQVWWEWIYNQPQRKSHKIDETIQKNLHIPIFVLSSALLFLSGIDFSFFSNRFAIRSLDRRYESTHKNDKYCGIWSFFSMFRSVGTHFVRSAVSMNEKLTFNALTHSAHSTLSVAFVWECVLCMCVSRIEYTNAGKYHK